MDAISILLKFSVHAFVFGIEFLYKHALPCFPHLGVSWFLNFQDGHLHVRQTVTWQVKVVPGCFPTRHFPTRRFPTRCFPTSDLFLPRHFPTRHFPTSDFSLLQTFFCRIVFLLQKFPYFRCFPTSDVSLPRHSMTNIFPTIPFAYTKTSLY